MVVGGKNSFNPLQLESSLTEVHSLGRTEPHFFSISISEMASSPLENQVTPLP